MSGRKNLYLNSLTWEQFNCYFIEWVSLVPAITFEQVLESSSSLGKVGKMSIS